MTSLGTLRPGAANTTGLPTTGSVIGNPGASTALSDDSDTTFDGQNTNTSGTYQHGRELGNTPADFGNMNTLSVQLRRAWESAPSNSTWDSLSARIMASNGSTVLAASTSGGAFQTVSSSITSTSPTNSSVIGFSFVNTSANKATWDGAIIQVQWVRTRNKGGDSLGCRVYEGSITGDYTIAAIETSGSGAITEAVDTVAASGDIPISGDGAVTESADMAAGTGDIPISGDGAVAELADAVSGSGTVEDQAITGDGAVVEASDTVAGTGDVPISGASAVAEVVDAVAGLGDIPISSTGAITEGPDTLAAVGDIPISGSGATTEAVDLVAGVASFGGETSGDGAVSEAADAVAGLGTVPISSSAAITETADTTTGLGNIPVSSSAAITELADTVAGTGDLASGGATGDAAITESADTITGVGGVAITGSGSITEANDVVTNTTRRRPRSGIGKARRRSGRIHRFQPPRSGEIHTKQSSGVSTT